MLKITLPQGATYQLETKSSVELVHGRGTYGNGSIDWGKDGLMVAEIVAKINEAPTDIVAIMIEGKLRKMDDFITEDSTIEWVRAGDAIGQAMRKRTAIFLLGYGLNSLQTGYKRLQGGIAECGVYYDFLPPEDGIGEDDLTKVQRAVAQALQSGEAIKARKAPYYTAIKYFGEQGEDAIKRYIEENDDGGAVNLQTFGEFAELDNGILLPNFEQIADLEVIALEKTAKGCRVVGKLAF